MARLIRQRVDVAPAGGEAACVTSKHGVFPAAAAKLKRRAGVSATSSRTPNTRLKLCDFKASSSASSVSLARPVSTIIKRLGSRPSRMRPAAVGRPSSAASTFGQHHKAQGFCFCPSSAKACNRRTPRRRLKPSAALQSPSAVPDPSLTGFTSCKAEVSRPVRAKRRSASLDPNCHEGLRAGACAEGTNEGCRRSIFSIAWRRFPRVILRFSSGCWLSLSAVPVLPSDPRAAIETRV